MRCASRCARRYAAAALRVQTGDTEGCGCGPSSCCGPGTTGSFGADLYDKGDRDALPDAARLASLGCGNPTAVADLREGEVVLDLGSGGGIDVLLSARRVGETGKAFGLDMTDEMLELARRNAAEAGATNVEFLKGQIEAIPLPDASIDVVISNCVINLSTDKPAVIAETFRVLRPGGRVGVQRRRRRGSPSGRTSGRRAAATWAVSPERSRWRVRDDRCGTPASARSA